MPEYLSPGVYVQEVDSGPRPIEGVGTAMAAFVGFAPAGPANRPVLVTNWTQYVENFSVLEDGGKRNPHMPGAFLSHAVYGYFLNGGGRCYVTRLVAGSTTNGKKGSAKLKEAKAEGPTLQLPSSSSKALPSITITPKGAPAEDIEVVIEPPKPEEGEKPNPETFTMRVKMGGMEEVFENVSLSKKSPKYVVDTVTQTSQLIDLMEEQTTGTLAERAPKPGTYTLKAPEPASLPTVQSSDFVGDVAERTGLDGLEVAEDVTMVCCPDIMASYMAGEIDKDAVKAIQLAMINHCDKMGDRIAILDTPPDLTPQEVKRWRERETNFDSKFAARDYPWIRVAGPDGRPLSIPPSGHIAGIYSRSDNERGVHKAPANEIVRGALQPEVQVTKGEQDLLNPIGINCIRSFTNLGIRVWGARTLSSDPAWRYINVRRLFNYVEKSIERGTQWIVFEPNDEDLWARVRRDVEAFLTTVWRDGALFGRTASEAFYVKCDAELNPPEVRDQGQLVIEVGLAPVKPAEFVIFRFKQWAGGGA